jgi:hypothetical protein
MDKTAAAEWLCQKSLMQFFNGLDDRRFDDMLARLAPDGVWVRQGVELKGRAGVSAVLVERSATVVSRHIVTNVAIQVTGDTASGEAVVTVYHHDDKTGALPAKLDAARSILGFKISFRLHPDGWLIERLGSTRLFAAESH